MALCSLSPYQIQPYPTQSTLNTYSLDLQQGIILVVIQSYIAVHKDSPDHYAILLSVVVSYVAAVTVRMITQAEEIVTRGSAVQRLQWFSPLVESDALTVPSCNVY